MTTGNVAKRVYLVIERFGDFRQRIDTDRAQHIRPAGVA